MTVTNNFKLGSLRVTKSVLGDGGPLYGQGPYEVSLACTVDRGGTATPIAIPGGAVRTLAPGSLTTTYTQLPVGAECTITETDVGGANSTAISVRTSGGTAVVTQGTSADVVIRDDTASTGTGHPGGRRDGAEHLRGRRGAGHQGDRRRREPPSSNGPFTMRIACTREVSGQTVAGHDPRRSDAHAHPCSSPSAVDPAARRGRVRGHGDRRRGGRLPHRPPRHGDGRRPHRAGHRDEHVRARGLHRLQERRRRRCGRPGRHPDRTPGDLLVHDVLHPGGQPARPARRLPRLQPRARRGQGPLRPAGRRRVHRDGDRQRDGRIHHARRDRERHRGPLGGRHHDPAHPGRGRRR